MKKLMTSAAIGLAFLVSACQPGGAGPETSEETPNRVASPAVWVASDNNSKLFLIGAVSMMPEDMFWKTSVVGLAADQAKTLILESDPSESATVEAVELSLNLGFYKDGSKLTDSLDDRGLKNLDLATTRMEMAAGSFNNFKPWLAANTLAVGTGGDVGLTDKKPMVSTLYSEANIKGHDILFLSTPEQQVRDLADMPADVQLRYLDRTLSEFSGLGEDLVETANAWHEGDLAALQVKHVSVLTQIPSSSYQSLIRSRNDAYLPKLVNFLEGSGTGLAVVQLPHLVDAGNLRVMLREKGYKVERYYGSE